MGCYQQRPVFAFTEERGPPVAMDLDGDFARRCLKLDRKRCGAPLRSNLLDEESSGICADRITEPGNAMGIVCTWNFSFMRHFRTNVAGRLPSCVSPEDGAA
jgi:hypothetical protein